MSSIEEKFVDRLSHLGIIAAAGERQEGKVSSWLSTNEITCPNCGRVEYGNVEQEKFKLCSLCLMSACSKGEGQENLAGVGLTVKPRGLGAARREGKPCERCGENFHGRSGRQRFCEKCQNAAKNDRNRAWMGDFRKPAPNMSVVDV